MGERFEDPTGPERPMGPERRDEGLPESEADAGLRDLRAAWRDLAPREIGGDVSEADEGTRRSVAWMASAWRALDVPPVPEATLAELRRRVGRVDSARAGASAGARWTPPVWLAAAGVLVAFAAALFAWRRSAEEMGDDLHSWVADADVADAVPSEPLALEAAIDPGGEGSVAVEPAPGTPAPASIPARVGAERTDLAPSADPEPTTERRVVSSIGSDHIELRSGSVRLTLLTGDDDRS